jgi:CPSF A subunit region
VLCQFTCQDNEEVTAIQLVPLSEADTAICIGTVFFTPGEKEPSQGRLLLLTAESDATLSSTGRQLKKTSEIDVHGCVYALARVNGLLAAAVGPSVSVLTPLRFLIPIVGTVLGCCVQSRCHGLHTDRGLVPQLPRHKPRR